MLLGALFDAWMAMFQRQILGRVKLTRTFSGQPVRSNLSMRSARALMAAAWISITRTLPVQHPMIGLLRTDSGKRPLQSRLLLCVKDGTQSCMLLREV